MGSVVVVGSLNIDSVVEVERHPRPGETLIGGDLEKHFGGKGANQAVAAARAGARVSFVGRVGDDADGDRYLERLAAFGIDTAHVSRSTGVATGHAAIAVSADGENTIIVSPGANGRVTAGDLAPLSALGPGDVVLCSLEIDPTVVAEAVRIAAGRGARAVVNLAPYVALPAEVLDLADPVVVNEHENEQLVADGLAPRSVLVTLGGDGSRWGAEEVAAGRVDEVVDTTGAGDCYCGTLAAALAAGATAGDAMRAASEAAALAVTWEGAQPAV
ncbi:ribokinase [Herbiconiux moechotypicola]|uniref:Ribokinase n=1 Tax=Herbiconiux moechotypicola TaxID=637393 RepID=A0ABN3DWD2_9MICO|nr:ribokinase [Herbiconiux moechotypicola]MCS5730911.1 ribokinase [Herbiconiux moechotypicola]